MTKDKPSKDKKENDILHWFCVANFRGGSEANAITYSYHLIRLFWLFTILSILKMSVC